MATIEKIRYNDEYELLIFKSKINKHLYNFEDAKLYCQILPPIGDYDWRLPTTLEMRCYGKKHLLPFLIWEQDMLLYGPKPYNGFEIWTIPVTLKYNPTLYKKFKSWLKNTTVANIVTKF